ncbi:MAG: 2TM domain-containing protein [Acaryochloridaceae cyanobacterium SU_2_1]|nr:2TM domain-containing protein [Acaryochloridaceae cyanobacterium SU_2_1]NJM95607.1 2TM domain-containing protein [Acaryochloridaceae cyanobacterium CSU_5_19]
MATAQPASELTYSQEDVQQILNLAIAQQAYAGEFSAQQLLEIAEELEISPSNLEAALQTWQTQSIEQQRRQNFDQYRQGNLKKQIGRYVIANGGLISVNALMGFTFPWSMYIALLWGLRLGLNAWNVYHTADEGYEKAFQRWERQRQVRQKINHWLGQVLST